MRGGEEGRKGSGAVGWRGKRWEAMGSQPGNREWGSREAEAGGAGTGIFALLLPIGHFTYEMVEYPGRNCHGWQFQETQGRMPVVSAPIGLTIYPHFISEIRLEAPAKTSPSPPRRLRLPGCPTPCCPAGCPSPPIASPAIPLPRSPSAPPFPLAKMDSSPFLLSSIEQLHLEIFPHVL